MALWVILGVIGGLTGWYGADAAHRAFDYPDPSLVFSSERTWVCDDCTYKRGVQASRPAVFAVDTANLRGKDWKRLKGITINVHTPENIVVVGKDFSVQGSVALEQGNYLSQYVQGNLSFHVPGLDVPAEGTFIMVNETMADKKTTEDFQMVVERLQEDRQEPELIEAIQNMAASI